MIPTVDNEAIRRAIAPGTVLLGYRGSIAHGTWEPPESEFSTDDIDLMGVAVGPVDFYLGTQGFLGKRQAAETFEGAYDAVTYEIRKFIRLLAGSNPNVMSLLWLPDDLYLLRSTAANILINRRSVFLSKRAREAYVGYAMSQIDRTEKHACKGFMGEKRRNLVERFGYDTKNAAHAIRLLRTGIELIETGRLNVRRADREELLAIKHGDRDLDWVKQEARRLHDYSQEALERSPLPDEVDYETVNRICRECVQTTLIERGEL